MKKIIKILSILLSLVVIIYFISYNFFNNELVHYNIGGWDVKLYKDSTFQYRYSHCGGINLVKGIWKQNKDTLIFNSFQFYTPKIKKKTEEKLWYYPSDSLKINLEIEFDYNYDSVKLYSICAGEKSLIKFNIQNEKSWHKSMIPFSSVNKDCKAFLYEINGYELPFEVEDYNSNEISIYIGAAEKEGSNMKRMMYFSNKKFHLIKDSLYEIVPIYRDRLVGIKK